jgi:hypothetical protein
MQYVVGGCTTPPVVFSKFGGQWVSQGCELNIGIRYVERYVAIQHWAAGWHLGPVSEWPCRGHMTDDLQCCCIFK